MMTSDDGQRYKSKKRLSSRARQMVLSLKQYFEVEEEMGGPLMPFSKIRERTAEALSIGRSTVQRIVNEERSTGQVLTPGKHRVRQCPVMKLDSFAIDAIRQHIYLDYYLQKKYPTVAKLLCSLKEAGLYEGSSSSLKTLLRKINFRFSRVSGRKLLLERPDIVAARARFVRRMCQVQVRWNCNSYYFIYDYKISFYLRN